jgi:hypothetical protein
MKFSAYLPYIAPCYFFLFPTVKNHWKGGLHFEATKVIQKYVTTDLKLLENALRKYFITNNKLLV